MWHCFLPETSEHTSIKRRVDSFKIQKAQPQQLAAFVGDPRESMSQGLPFHLKDYIELVDLSGRAIWENRRGYIDNNFPPILDRPGISSGEWFILTTQYESRFKSLVGCKEKLKVAIESFGLKRRPALSNCEAILH